MNANARSLPLSTPRCTSLRHRVKELKDELEACRSKLAASAQDFQNALKDKASLSHALDLRAAQLSAEGGADVPSRLLYAVAKGREEARTAVHCTLTRSLSFAGDVRLKN